MLFPAAKWLLWKTSSSGSLLSPAYRTHAPLSKLKLADGVLLAISSLLWDPVIGSGPFVGGLVPTDMPLSDGVKVLLCALAHKGNIGLGVADLSLYIGFDRHGKPEPAPARRHICPKG